MDYKEDIKKLKSIFGVFNNKELAKKLGITEDAIKAWGKKKQVPEKYKNTINGNNNIQINGAKKSEININSSNETESKLINMIKSLTEKEQNYYYHLIQTDQLKKDL